MKTMVCYKRKQNTLIPVSAFHSGVIWETQEIVSLFRQPGKSFGDVVVLPALSQAFSEGGQVKISASPAFPTWCPRLLAWSQGERNQG